MNSDNYATQNVRHFVSTVGNLVDNLFMWYELKEIYLGYWITAKCLKISQFEQRVFAVETDVT